VEWSLSIEGDPALVERAAHARLAERRHAKEFFRVSVNEASDAIREAYSSLYPDREDVTSLVMDERCQAIEAQRRAELAKLEEARRRREYESSPEYLWLMKGSVKRTFAELKGPKSEPLGFFASLFKDPPPDWIEVDLIGRQGYAARGEPPWRLILRGLSGGRRFWLYRDYDDPRIALNALRGILRKFPITDRGITLEAATELLNIDVPSRDQLVQPYKNGPFVYESTSLTQLTVKGIGVVDLGWLAWANADAATPDEANLTSDSTM
jgi:hypothetical protein